MSLKTLVILTFLACFIIFSKEAPDDALLKMGQKDNCIKQIINQYLHTNDCHNINDSLKSQLALLMTNCLFKQMKKPEIPLCSNQPCQIKGDAWNTFSIFFNHIDNLCHFYREIIWQEKAESLVISLTGSAQITYDLMQKNSKETSQILGLQNNIKELMQNTISEQKEMIYLLGNSTLQINNLTKDIQNFLHQIHQDIDQKYSSLRIILSAISQTLDKLTSIQSYLLAEIHSVNGILFYLILFVFSCFFTSIRKFQQKKSIILTTVLISFLFQWIFSSYISLFMGSRIFRSLIMIGIFTYLFKSNDSKEEKMDKILAKHLNTAKMARILKKSMQLKQIQESKQQ